MPRLQLALCGGGGSMLRICMYMLKLTSGAVV